jgi:hypothetical protein
MDLSVDCNLSETYLEESADNFVCNEEVAYKYGADGYKDELDADYNARKGKDKSSYSDSWAENC